MSLFLMEGLFFTMMVSSVIFLLFRLVNYSVHSDRGSRDFSATIPQILQELLHGFLKEMLQESL